MFPVLAGSNPSGYNLTRSLRFRSSASAYLSRTPASAGNRQTWTWSGWVKRGTQGTSQGIFAAATSGSALAELYFNTSNALSFYDYTGAYNLQLVSTQVFRDSSAWYHIVVALDTTNATAANRVKIYVNGAQVTALSTATYPSQNYQGYVNNNIAHYTSTYNGSTDLYDGYLTEVNFIDGQALTPSSFGSTNALTGVWQPARYTGTYGTNGFYLPFTDNSALTTSSNVGLGKDFSGNGNYWVTNNISITSGVTYDSMTDVPTLTSATAANFAVLNPLWAQPSGPVTSNGNLSCTNNYYSIASSISVSSGKWYCEFTRGSTSSLIGIVPLGFNIGTDPGASATSYSYQDTGKKYNSSTLTTYGATYTTGDVIGVAMDLDGGNLTFYKNGVSQGVAFTGISGTYFFAFSAIAAGVSSINFGQQPFVYTPPTGYVALNTYNLPTPTILAGNKYMDATLYTGNGSTQSIVNAAAFKPDLIWIKARSSAQTHDLTDSVRGVGKPLFSNLTNAEGSGYTDQVTAFNSNGFSLGDNATGIGGVNTNAVTYVGWQWQAGQGTTSSNTNGTITSTVSVNANTGFSVVTYTGTGANATVGHGLGVTPAMIIIKARSTTGSWQTYHSSIGNTSAVFLDLTSAAFASSVYWNNTSPTSSVFTIGTSSFVNVGSQTQVAYCFAPIAGYSAFGSLTGNGSADGPMVYTGFLPRFILYKRTDTTSDWRIWDTARNTYNAMSSILYPNASDAELTASSQDFDALSNGFKVRNSSAAMNASGGTYIYAAFATSPFRYSLAR